MATSVADLITVARKNQISVDATSLAFYAFNSLVALSVMIYAVFALYGTGNVLAQLLQLLTGVGALEFQRILDQIGGNSAGQRRASVLAFVIAIWSSLRLFRGVERVFSEVYEIRKERSLLKRLIDSVLVLAAVIVTIVAIASIGSIFVFRATGWVWTVGGPMVLWLTLSALLLPMYYRFSGVDVSVRETLPGTVFAAAGWTVSMSGLRMYVGISESVDLFGIIGAILLLLTWLYFVGLSIVLGVILNALLAGRMEPD